MRALLMDAIPSDLRNLERASVDRGWKFHHATRNDAEAVYAAIFGAVIEQHLDADADAKEGGAGFRNIVAQAFLEAERAEVFHRGTRRADARQDDAIGGANLLRAIGDLTSMAEVGESAGHTGKVSRLIVDDSDHLQTPDKTS
jgi:hypothetical protein